MVGFVLICDCMINCYVCFVIS